MTRLVNALEGGNEIGRGLVKLELPSPRVSPPCDATLAAARLEPVQEVVVVVVAVDIAAGPIVGATDAGACIGGIHVVVCGLVRVSAVL